MSERDGFETVGREAGAIIQLTDVTYRHRRYDADTLLLLLIQQNK